LDFKCPYLLMFYVLVCINSQILIYGRMKTTHSRWKHEYNEHWGGKRLTQFKIIVVPLLTTKNYLSTYLFWVAFSYLQYLIIVEIIMFSN